MPLQNFFHVDPCSANPCFPGVSCIPGHQRENVHCGPCPPGYSGNGFHCERFITCKDNPCANGKL